MAAPETTNNVTVRKLTSLMSQLWTKIKNALQGKQDNLGISSSGDTTKFLNQKGQWAAPSGTEQVNADWDATSGKAEILHKPTVSRYFNNYSRNTSVYGWKIGSTVTGNADGVSSVITGVFTLALGVVTDYAPQEGSTVKTKATMVGFFSCYARHENGANVVKARIYTPVSSISDSTFNLKYIDEGNGKITWVLGFGTGTTPASKAYVYCSVNVMSSFNADFGNFGDAITSAPTYPSNAYFTVFKSPYIPQTTSGIGSATKPTFVNENGEVKACSNYDLSANAVDTSYPSGAPFSPEKSEMVTTIDAFDIKFSQMILNKPYRIWGGNRGAVVTNDTTSNVTVYSPGLTSWTLGKNSGGKMNTHSSTNLHAVCALLVKTSSTTLVYVRGY